MGAEKSADLNRSQVETADKTKYSIIALLSRLGASKEKTTLESRKDLWSKYQEEIRKGTDVDEKYSGKAEQNIAMLKYLKGRIKGGEVFDVETLEFKKTAVVLETAKQTQELRKEIEGGKGKEQATAPMNEERGLEAEEVAMRKAKRQEQAIIDSGNTRDADYERAIQKEQELFDPTKEASNPETMKQELSKKASIDDEISSEWLKSSSNTNWKNINTPGRDTVEKNLQNIGMNIADLKASFQGKEISADALFAKIGYKSVNGATKIYETLKKDMEKNRVALEKLASTMRSVKKIIETIDNKDIFYYKKHTERKEQEEKLDPETEKILAVLDAVFPKTAKGPVTMEEIQDGKVTKDTSEFERTSSYAAAYFRIKEEIVDDAGSDKTRENLVAKLNTYIELSLIKAGKREDMGKSAVTAEMIKSGKLEKNTIELIRAGYIAERKLEASKEKATIRYSESPEINALLKDFKNKKNLSDEQLIKMGKRIEQKFHGGIGVGFEEVDGTLKATLGAGGDVDLGGGYFFRAGVSVGETNGLVLEGGKRWKLPKGASVSLSGGIFATTDGKIGPVADINLQLPVTETLDLSIGAGVGVDVLTLRAGVGGSIGIRTNAERALEKSLREKYEKTGIAQIEKSDDKYKALMEHPVLGKQIRGLLEIAERDMKAQGKTLDEAYKAAIVMEIYESIKHDIDTKNTADFDLPPITGFGVAFTLVPPFIIPHITFSIGKSTKVLRLVEASDAKIDDANVKKQLEAAIRGDRKRVINLGRSGRITMNEKGEETVTPDASAKFNGSNTVAYEDLNDVLKKVNIKLIPENSVYRISIGKQGGPANIKVFLDPSLKDTALIHNGNDFFLNTNLKESLFITRKEQHYPFEKNGAYNDISIYISKDTVSQTALENTSEAYLEKNIGMAIEEVGKKSKLDANQILDYNTFTKLQAEGKIPKFEIRSRKDFDEAAAKVQEKNEKPRDNIEVLVKEWYENGDKKHQTYLKKLTTEYNRGLQVDYGKVFEDFESFLAKKGDANPKLSEADRSAARNYLIVNTFRDFSEKTVIERKKALEKESPWIKQMIMEYIENTTYKNYKGEIADTIMKHIKTTTFSEAEWKAIDAKETGNLFVSMVGTQHIHGARRSNNYAGLGYRLINPKEFDIHSPDPAEARAARALIEVISPLDRSSAANFLRSPISLKMAGIIPYAFKPEDKELYNDIKKSGNPDIDVAHQTFYKKFVAMIEKVREYEQDSGAKSVNLGPEYNDIVVKFDIKTNIGLFEKCQNFTMIGKETFEYFDANGQIFASAQASRDVTVREGMRTEVNELTIGAGFGKRTTGVGEKPKEAKPETAHEVAPQVKVEVGDGRQNGQSQAAPQSGGSIDTTGF